MKITKSQLKKVIKEELMALMLEKKEEDEEKKKILKELESFKITLFSLSLIPKKIKLFLRV